MHLSLTRKLVLLLAIIFGLSGSAQDCASPTQLCFNPIPGNNQQFDSTNWSNSITPLMLDCFMATNGVVYEVETLAPGAIDVEVSNILCDSLDNPDYGSELQIAIYEAPDPCATTGYTELDCSQGLGILELSTLALDSGQVYYIAVSGVTGNVFPALCGYAIQISGDAVEYDFSAAPEYVINQGEAVLLLTQGSLSEYQWQPEETLDDPTSPSPIASPLISTLYTVEGTIGDCVITTDVFVEVIPGIRAMNLITPNADGKNDEWLISGIQQFPNADVRIFSRWGQQVFRSVGYRERWDGTFGGSVVPSGTYYYVIDKNTTGEDNEPVTGSIAVVY